jgi:hypothetical protein
MNLQSGSKLNMLSRPYNMIMVNHRPRILSSTSGHPGTLERQDYCFVCWCFCLRYLWRWNTRWQWIHSIWTGWNWDAIGVQYQGAWLLVDNGYLSWPTTVPPFNRMIHYKEISFLQWLESIQKDVTWTFGIGTKNKNKTQILRGCA